MKGRKVGKDMADIEITYSCGCGFKTKVEQEAVEHSDQKNHSLTVLGMIKKNKN